MTRIKNTQSVKSVPSVSHYCFRTRIQRIRRKNQRAQITQICVISVLFYLLLATAVSAQETITLTTDRDILTVGDPIEISIAVAHPPGTTARLAATDWGDFELLADPDVKTTATGTTLHLRLTLWAPGEYELPPLPITLTNDAGQSETAVTTPLTFTVTSVLTEDDRELRDIRPQASLPQSRLWWPWLFLAVGLVAGGTAVWHKRRSTTKPFTALPTAQAEALAALDALGEPQPGKWAAFATAVLHILRRFLQQTTDIPTDFRTTSELAAALPQTPLSSDQQAELVALLQQIDTLRFSPQSEKFIATTLTEPARSIILHAPQEELHP